MCIFCKQTVSLEYHRCGEQAWDAQFHDIIGAEHARSDRWDAECVLADHKDEFNFDIDGQTRVEQFVARVHP